MLLSVTTNNSTMKKPFLIGIFMTVLIGWTNAQISVNKDNSDPDQSAGLDVKFDDKGFLPPRMTTSQMHAIANPAEGLMIYNTDMHSYCYHDGTGWKRMDGQHFIGESYGGGIVFYLDGTGQHGLIAAAVDQDMGEFGCYQMEIGGTSTLFGTGQANTTLIVNFCPIPGIAARICDELVLNGYDDWYLPSRDELVEMYNHKDVIGVFADDFYWTSSECTAELALAHSFTYNYNYCRGKYDYSHVRAVRTF